MRRFSAYSNYLKQEYGHRLQKLSINAGFTCPNRDGSKSVGGCTFCNNEAFNPSYCTLDKSITQQLEEGKSFHKWRYRKAPKYLAYFQAYSNTYADIDKLKELYLEALSVEDVVGLVIGTRPDCIDDEKLKFLSDLTKNYFVHLEIGIESCYDKTLKRINRGHDYGCAVDAFGMAKKYNINTGTHLILGLPGESKTEILNQANIVSSLPIKTIKLHQLQIVKDTLMEEEYKENPKAFSFFSVDEYVNFVVDFLERLSPDILVERLSGEVPPSFQAGPCFDQLRGDQLLNLIEKCLEERDTYQGRLYVKQQIN